MFIELVSILRCPRPHEDTWLVATIDDMENRDIVNGVLGCPVCHAEYRVRDRVAYFAEPANGPRDGTVPSPQQAMRLAAALELTEARSVAVLNGDWSAQARLVRALSPAQLLVLNPTSAIDAGDGVSVVVSA